MKIKWIKEMDHSTKLFGVIVTGPEMINSLDVEERNSCKTR